MTVPGYLTLNYGSAQKLLGVLSAKCPIFTGLLQTDYAKLFLNDPQGDKILSLFLSPFHLQLLQKLQLIN
jgi:hypothetical protein